MSKLSLLSLIVLFSFIQTIHATNITLKDSNFVSLRGPVTTESITQLISKMLTFDDDTIYIYINSPGGSVDAGMKLVTYIKSLQEQDIVVNCIAENAMSMGFVIFQYCDNRYITKYATLMQHQMSLGNIKGKIKEINSYIGYINSMENTINEDQAKRIGLSIDEFNDKINNDWWLYSTEIIDNKVADKIVSIKCSFKNYDETLTFDSIFGEISVIYSRWPTIDDSDDKIDIDDFKLIESVFNNNARYKPQYLDRFIEIVGVNFF